jgi:phenylalanine-4-hydroxylase
LFFLLVEPQYQKFLARIFWFTIEFWLIQEGGDLRIYGAGILSSHGETLRTLEDSTIEIVPFDILTCMRTPYRYDIMQSKYFVIESFDELFSMFESHDMSTLLEEARVLGDLT